MKTSHILSIVLIISLGFIFSGCDEIDGPCTRGEGSNEVETLALPPITGIDMKVAGKVYVRQGLTQEVKVWGQSNIIELLSIDVDDEIWEIEFDGCVRNYDDLRIEITLVELDYAHLSGAGKIIGEGEIIGKNLDVSVSGAGEVDLTFSGEEVKMRLSGAGKIRSSLAIDHLEARISGAGDISLDGSTSSQELRISGAGDYRAFDLASQSADIRISGAGSARVSVSDQLSASVSGSGNVLYKGSPSLDLNISGSGKVRSAN